MLVLTVDRDDERVVVVRDVQDALGALGEREEDVAGAEPGGVVEESEWLAVVDAELEGTCVP